MFHKWLIQLNYIKINWKYGKTMWVRAYLAKGSFLKQNIWFSIVLLKNWRYQHVITKEKFPIYDKNYHLHIIRINLYLCCHKGPWRTAEKSNALFVTQIKLEMNNWSFLLSQLRELVISTPLILTNLVSLLLIPSVRKKVRPCHHNPFRPSSVQVKITDFWRNERHHCQKFWAYYKSTFTKHEQLT